ncbi:MAG: cupredoxin domain-containing protein [Gemmatimonadaceae bacterium]|nr:cupredoxin domain-containing protein [Gemmatimonadaceae bacterium]
MHTTDWFVLLAALAGVSWVNWYFFLANRDAASVTAAIISGDSSNAGGGAAAMQSATIVVRGGYEPATIRVRAGAPVRLVFDRQETSSCSEEIVFPDFGLRKFLPAHQQTTLIVTPPTPGTYEFTCGMSMLHGRLIAEASA